MKSLLILSMMCISLSASAIGHPHNLFSAYRKAQRMPKKALLCQQAAAPKPATKRILGS